MRSIPPVAFIVFLIDFLSWGRTGGRGALKSDSEKIRFMCPWKMKGGIFFSPSYLPLHLISVKSHNLWLIVMACVKRNYNPAYLGLVSIYISSLIFAKREDFLYCKTIFYTLIFIFCLLLFKAFFHFILSYLFWYYNRFIYMYMYISMSVCLSIHHSNQSFIRIPDHNTTASTSGNKWRKMLCCGKCTWICTFVVVVVDTEPLYDLRSQTCVLFNSLIWSNVFLWF